MEVPTGKIYGCCGNDIVRFEIGVHYGTPYCPGCMECAGSEEQYWDNVVY